MEWINFTSISWEQRKWLDTVNISTDMVDPRTGAFDKLPHVAPGNIESFSGRIYNNVKTVGDENLISGKFHFHAGDIVYGKINPQLGKYFLANFEGLTSADAYVLNAKNGINQKFLYTLLQTEDFYRYSVSVSKRSGMPKINREELNAYSFLSPSEKEQIRIGAFLIQLENLITLHQRKLKIHQIGETYFLNIVWEQRKLSELTAVFYSGKGIQAAEIMETGQYPVYGGNGLRGYADIYNYDGEFALIGRQGALCGNMNYSLGRAYFTEHAVVVKANNDNNTRFLYYMLDTMKLGRYSDQSAQPGLAVNKLIKLTGIVPKREEQKCIAEYLTNLDNLITLHQSKLEKLQKIKKSMLERMFV